MLWSTRRFFWLLGLITAGALGVRLAYVIGVRWDQTLWGDAFIYHHMANGLVDGFGFQLWVPKSFVHDTGQVILNAPESASRVAVAVGPAANNRPVFPLYLAAWSVLGLRSYHWHMIASTFLGAGSVFMMGLVGRKIAGPRVGIVAALIAAVYGNFWVNDSVVTSESLAILLSATLLLLAYRAYESPTLKRVLAIGAVCGFAALVRSEFLFLVPLLIIPLLVRRLAGHSMKERVGLLFAAGAAALLVMSPWLIRNLTTFEKPVLLGADGGITLAATSCDETFYGDSVGWWSPKCIVDVTVVKRDGRCRAVPTETAVLTKRRMCDPSEADEVWRRRAVDYIGDHVGRLPVVLAARLATMWELFHPGSPWGEIQPNQKIARDITEGRSEMAARLSLAQFYLLVPFVIAGGVILWRRKQTIAPLVALPILTSFIAMSTFGNTRYRSIAEPALVALGAVAVDALIVRFWDKRRARDPEPPPDPSRAEELQPA